LQSHYDHSSLARTGRLYRHHDSRPAPGETPSVAGICHNTGCIACQITMSVTLGGGSVWCGGMYHPSGVTVVAILKSIEEIHSICAADSNTNGVAEKTAVNRSYYRNARRSCPRRPDDMPADGSNSGSISN